MKTQLERPKGRPKATDVAARESRLLKIAAAIFFRKGYGGTTMSEVADAARCSKTTLYSRYPAKADLFRAIVADQVESWGTGLHHTPIEDGLGLRDTLILYGDIVLRAGLTPDFVHLHRLMQSESGRFPELGEIAHFRLRLGIAYVSERIAHFARAEAVPCNDAERIAEIFLMTLMGWVGVAVGENRKISDPERRAWLTAAVDVLLGGRLNW